MSKRRASFIGNLGWGFLADILLFATAILLMSIFAFTSFSNAYLIALLVLSVVVLAFLVYKRRRGRLIDETTNR